MKTSFDRFDAVTLWPSGLRRNVKAVVLIGGGSNPLDVIFMLFATLKLSLLRSLLLAVDDRFSQIRIDKN